MCKIFTIKVINLFNHFCSFAEKVEVFRGIESMKTRLSITEISDNLSTKEILKVNYYKLGVFLDLDCPKSEIILDQVML